MSTAVADSLPAHAVGRLRAAAVGAAGLEAAASGADAIDVLAAGEAAGAAWDMQHPSLAYVLDPDAETTVNIPLRTYARLVGIEREAVAVGQKVLYHRNRKDKRIRLGVFRRLMSMVGMVLPPVEGENR